MPKPARKHYTWDDLVAMPDDGKRYEIIDGELLVSPAPVTAHQFASRELFLALNSWAARRGGGLVLYAPLDVILAPDTVVQPDVMWIAEERIAEIASDWIRGIPDLVVEILSPSTARRDRLKKSEVYARFGAREYWLVDPRNGTVEIRKRVDGAFVMHAQGAGDAALASALDADLTVVPARLFRAFGRGRGGEGGI